MVHMILQLVTYAFLSLFLDDETKDSAEEKFGASPLQRSFCSEARFELVSREGGGSAFPTTCSFTVMFQISK